MCCRGHSAVHSHYTHQHSQPLVPNVQIRKSFWAISTDYCGRDYKVSSVRHNQTAELAWRCQGFLWRKERSTGMKRVQESTPTQQEHSILLQFVGRQGSTYPAGHTVLQLPALLPRSWNHRSDPHSCLLNFLPVGV